MNGEMVLEIIQLKSCPTIVILQSTTDVDPSDAAWLNAVDAMLELESQREGSTKIRLIAVTDGAQPTERARTKLTPALKQWKMAIVSDQNTFGGKLINKVMNFLIRRVKIPAQFFNLEKSDDVLEYIELTPHERTELTPKIRHIAGANPSHRTLNKFSKILHQTHDSIRI